VPRVRHPANSTADSTAGFSARLPGRLLIPALVVAAGLPIIALVVGRTGRSYFPAGDYGVFDLRLRDVMTTSTPLTGVYSRFGWSHPGPLLYYLLAPLSALTGGAPWATQVGAGLLQAAAIVWGAVLVTRRISGPRGRAVAAGWLLVVAIGYESTGAWVVLQPWNPNVALPWFALYLLLCWLIALRGRPVDVLAALAVLSFLIQTHAGYAPFALVLLLALLLAARGRSWSALERPARSRFLVAAFALLFVLWLPVIVDAIIHPPGNAWRIITYFFASHPGQESVGFPQAARLMARPFAWPLPWLGAGDAGNGLSGTAQESSAWWLLLPVVLLTVAGYTAHRRGDRQARNAVILAAFTLLVGLVAISQVTPPADAYLFYWRLVLAPLVIAVALAVLAMPMLASWHSRSSWPSWSKAKAATALAAIAVAFALTAPVSAGVLRDKTDSTGIEPVVEAMSNQLQARGLPDRPVVIRFVGQPLLGLEGGLIDELDRRTGLVRGDLDRAAQLGTRRAVPRDQVKQVWLVVEDGNQLSRLAAAPHADVLVRWSPLSEVDEQRLEVLQRDIADQLRSRGHDDLAGGLDDPLISLAVARLHKVPAGELHEEADLVNRARKEAVCRCAVIAFPSGQVPAT
jgi:hypothetical protein